MPHVWLGRWAGGLTREESPLLNHEIAITLPMERAQGQVWSRLLSSLLALSLVFPGCSTNLPGRFPGAISWRVVSLITSLCMWSKRNWLEFYKQGKLPPLSIKFTLSIPHQPQVLEPKVSLSIGSSRKDHRAQGGDQDCSSPLFSKPFCIL